MSKEHYTHLINGWEFIIEDGGWGGFSWSTDGYESEGLFEMQAECLQDAINWVGNRAREEREAEEQEAEDRAYGTDRQQVNSHWMGTRL